MAVRGCMFGYKFERQTGTGEELRSKEHRREGVGRRWCAICPEGLKGLEWEGCVGWRRDKTGGRRTGRDR